MTGVQTCALPILAFERAIYECAVAGCETIWIVSHRETTPLLRHRLGDWVYDPVINPSLKGKYVDRPSEHLKQIPLYYVPVSTKDRGVRDGLVWSIFYGIRKAYHISQYFSKWVTPNRYYVAFPYSTYNALDIRPHRIDISSGKPFFIQTPDGKKVTIRGVDYPEGVLLAAESNPVQDQSIK